VTFDPKYNAPGTQPGKTATIFVNAADPPTRQNFTVAHEIGHVKLGHVRKEDGFRAERFRAQGQPYDGNEEREANQFAGALLMPAPAFAKALYKQRNMTSVALTFGVSVQAASIRAYELGLITGA
jgi:Zn-dependent peptidase ImmA (M78 family)